jgi:tenellin biosynthesis cytochrome P450 monooxygenase
MIDDVLIGLRIGRNDDYLATSIKAIDSVVANAGVTGLMPAFLRPIFGRLACWNTQRTLLELESQVKVMLEKRLAHMNSHPEDDSNDPIDLEQRMLRYASKHRRSELRTDELTRRLVMTNLGFVYQGSYAAANTIRNILESDQRYDTIAVLRKEAKRFIAAEPDPSRLWRRNNVARMVFADSAARESLRLNTVPTRALVRQVMVDGLKTDTGLPLPKGALVSFVSQPMHTDPDLFPDPNTYDPFRFVRLRDIDNTANGDKTPPSVDTDGIRSPHAFLSTSNLLVFGRGRNSCPGRYLVDFQLKMLISYLFTHYDVKPLEKDKVERKWLLEFIYPPTGVKMVVKRRA